MLTKIDVKQIRQAIKEELYNHPTKQDLAKELKSMKNDIAEIRKDTKGIVSFFDRGYVELRKRIERIENHLGFSAS